MIEELEFKWFGVPLIPLRETLPEPLVEVLVTTGKCFVTSSFLTLTT